LVWNNPTQINRNKKAQELKDIILIDKATMQLDELYQLNLMLLHTILNGKQPSKGVVASGYQKLMSLSYLYKMMVNFIFSKIHKSWTKI